MLDIFKTKQSLLALPLAMSLIFGVVSENMTMTQAATAKASLDEATLAKRYAGKELKVVDVSEIQVNGASTLSVTFSVPLKAGQAFNDKLHLVDAKSGKVDGAWVLSDNQLALTFNSLEPNRKLILTVDSGLRGVNGRSLPIEHVSRLTTKNLQPMINFASRGSLFPVRLAEGLPVLTLNVDQATVEFFKVQDNKLPQFLSEWGRGGSLRYWQATDLLKMADLVYTGGFKLEAEKNRRETVMLPIANIQQLKQPGVYFAVLRQSGSYDYSNAATVFTISDIGVSAHRYKTNDNITVFTQSLDTGNPIIGADIKLLDEKGNVIANVSTNTKGYAEIEQADKASVVLASHDGQTTMLRLKTSALDLSEFTVTGPEEAINQLFIFGPRDLYRPGETVLFNALLRDKDGKQIAKTPVNVDVRSPDGKVVRSFVWKTNDQGFYQFKLPIPNDAPTGRWSFLVTVAGKKLQDYHFNIEDFLPERLALELKAQDEPLSPTDTMYVGVDGRYLYGAPAGGNSLSGQVYVRAAREAVAKLPGYLFGNINEKYLSQNIDFTEFNLDGEGKGTIKLDSQWKEVKSPLQLIVQASLQETGGRPIVRRVIQPVWPASELVGIRPLFKDKEVDEGSNVEFEVVLANYQGDKLAAKNLKARLIHERRDYYWYYSEDNGWNSNFNQKDLVMDEQTINITKGTTAKLTYPVEWGYYRLEIENPVTGLITSQQFRAGYWWQENTTDGGAVRPDQVKMVMDKPAYKVGDKAKITVTPPAAGSGYLMIESSDGLLWWQAIEVPATGKTFEIPIPADAQWQRHDLYISTLVVRPGSRKVGATPKRAVGVLHLPLDRQARKLNLAIDAPSRAAPSEKLVVKVKATDKEGKPVKNARVLLSAVDVGILNITEYKTPDPFDGFFGRKAYGVDQLDVYGQLIETGQGRIAKLAFGGDAMSKGGKKPDTNVMIVALQSEPVRVNDKGEAEVSFTIPDFNGELRLMAQVWADESFGMSEAKTVIAAPIIAELSTPRFLAGGDTAVLALDVTNLTDKPQKLKVMLASEGQVSLLDNKEQTITVAKDQRQTIKVPVKAGEGIGSGKITLIVSGILQGDKPLPDIKREWKIGTRPAYPAVVETFQEVLENSPWNVPTGTMDAMMLDGREGMLQLTATPPLNLSKQIQSLRAYPYGCAEQTVSGLYPSLYANNSLLEKLGIKTKQTDEERRAAIDTGISRLLGMQRYNGGFGLWSSDSREDYWLTAYVTDYLLRARERGFSVPSASLEKAIKRLQTYMQNSSVITPYYSHSEKATRFATQAYAGYVLARSQQAPLGALRALYDRRGDAPSGLSLVQLSAALKLMGDNTRAEQALTEGLTKSRHKPAQYYWWIGDYGSDARDDALILALLQEHDMASQKVIADRMFKLSNQIANKRWLSTQERNSIFLAGYRTLLSTSHPWKADVSVAGKQYTLTDKNPSMTFNDEAMRQITTLTVTNKTPSVTLYQTLDLSGYPKEAPQASNADGLFVTKEYLKPDGSPLDLKNVTSGDLVIVRIKLKTKERISDALLVDFLPAGLELENQNLANSSASLNNAAASIKDSLKSMQRARIEHQEFRDDRYVLQLDLGYNYSNLATEIVYLARAVTPGEYLIPQAIVESMYRPNWQASSRAPGVLVVKPK